MKKHLTLQQKLMLGCSALLVGILLLLGVTIIPQRLRSFNTELDDRIALTARIVAESSDAENALTAGKVPAEWMARLDALSAETVGLDYVVVADRTGKRIYHLSECLLAVTPDGRLLFANAQARKLLPDSKLPADFPLWPEVRAAFAAGTPCSDQLIEWAEYIFLAKTVPLDKAGVLVILRDHTEYTRIDQQLTGTNHVLEALRANTHEFLNKLHGISGLLQIGETQKAIAFINGVSEDVENNYQSIIRQLHNRTVAALVLGKVSHARELDIQFSLRRDSTPPAHSAYLSSRELVTIVGNLVENAFDAVKAAPLKQVGLFIGEDANGLTITVDDTGHGMTETQIATVRQRQYTTKGYGHGFGLRLIQQIVAGRRGYLEIESEPGEGSSFTVNFTEKREVPEEC